MPFVMESVHEDLPILAEKTLRQLGISGKLIGHQFLISAICQTVHDPSLPQHITKCLYPSIAKQYHCDVRCVERNIRTAIKFCWKYGGRDKLRQLTQYDVPEHPTNADFIDRISAHLRLSMHG